MTGAPDLTKAFRVTAGPEPATNRKVLKKLAPAKAGDRGRVRAPATTSNIGPGFDAFGLALTLENEATFEPAERWEVLIAGEGSEVLPTDSTNLIALACALGLEAWKTPMKARITCVNRVPLGRGLGSSAAAIVTGLAGAAALSGREPGRDEILELALTLEPHPDNLAACLWGSFTIAAPPHVVTLPWPDALRIVAAIPDFAVETAKARQILPKQVSLQDAVHNIARAATLAAAVASDSFIPTWALDDRLHQDHRAPLVRAWPAAREAAIRAGALGAAISGSGPTVVAFTQDHAPDVGKAMVAEFVKAGARARALELGPAAGASWKR
ncbi:MAG: homoserine kinase [Planctomycetes bacterium]|nr:homoserine kinase [Planctomycetota bacterium]